VVDVYVADGALDGRTPVPAALDLVGRMGGDLWCTTRDTFALPRPATVDAGELGRLAAALRRAHTDGTEAACG
jgi:hypothetical protein